MRYNFHLILLTLFFYSCKDHVEKKIDKQPPQIEVHYPEDNFFYKQKDTVYIKALMTDNEALRYGSVHIHDQFKPFGEDTVFVYEFRIKGKAVELDTFWIVDDPLDKNYSIYFDAVDQAENLTDKLRTFYQYHE